MPGESKTTSLPVILIKRGGLISTALLGAQALLIAGFLVDVRLEDSVELVPPTGILLSALALIACVAAMGWAVLLLLRERVVLGLVVLMSAIVEFPIVTRILEHVLSDVLSS